MSRLLGLGLSLVLCLGSWIAHERPAAAQDSGAGIVYVALGDSIATGVGATTPYPELFRQAIAAQMGVPVELINLGCPGCTSTDLLNGLRTNQSAREALSRAQIITWDIGGNDFLGARTTFSQGACGGPDGQDCLRAAVLRFQQNWDAIMGDLGELTNGRSVLLLTMDIYDPFVRETSGTEVGSSSLEMALFGPYLDAITAYMATTASANGIAFATIRPAFNGPDGTEDPFQKGLMADPIHPNDEGHQRIMDAMLQVAGPRLDALKSQLGN
jgi:lysophospholipase L1-like esterase